MSPKGLVIFYQALSNGGEGQHYINGNWKPVSSGPDLTSISARFRIKPKPIERWINIYPGDNRGSVYINESEALDLVCEGGTTIKMREVEE